MTSIIETISTNIKDSIMNELTTTLLQAISTEFNIPLEQLQNIAKSQIKTGGGGGSGGSAVTDTTTTTKPTGSNSNSNSTGIIKAKPKAKPKKAQKSPSVSHSQASLASLSSEEKELERLQSLIEKAKAAGKLFNTATSRPINDNPANRKKYKFYEELGIVGLANDQKLVKCLKLLGAPDPTKKPVPLHIQAEKAKSQATATTSDDENDSLCSSSSSDTLSLQKSETKKVITKNSNSGDSASLPAEKDELLF